METFEILAIIEGRIKALEDIIGNPMYFVSYDNERIRLGRLSAYKTMKQEILDRLNKESNDND